MTKKVYVALPAYTGEIRVETAACLLQASRECLARGWQFDLKLAIGDSMIPRARNRFVACAIADPDVTDLVFVDHDVAWGPGDFVRLLSHPVDVVAGVYPKREDPISYPVRWLEGNELPIDKTTGLIEVEGVPAGFLRLTTAGLRRMVERYADLEYHENHAPEDKAWALFEFTRTNGRFWGEDFVFCQRWRNMGGTVWVDPDMEFHHIGTKAYRGHLVEWILDNMRKPDDPVSSAAA